MSNYRYVLVSMSNGTWEGFHKLESLLSHVERNKLDPKTHIVFGSGALVTAYVLDVKAALKEV